MNFVRASVCLATYNGSDFLEKQLLSILTQLSDMDEVIISDDKSTDNTIEIVKSFADERIRIILNNGKNGPVNNFENAIKEANGKYIILSDQDDIWNFDKLSEMIDCLQNNDLVLSDCVVVDRSEQVMYPSFFQYRGSGPGFWKNVYRNSYMGCCMGFRREVLQYILPFPKYIHMHDWWIGLMIELRGKVFFNTKPLIKYVRHNKNASPTGEKGYNVCKKAFIRVTILICVASRVLSLKMKV